MQNFNQNIINLFQNLSFLENWKKAKLQKAKTNDLKWTKYANQNKLKLPKPICLVSPSPT